MVFKKLLAALGVGGPEVETTLHNPNVRPGDVLTGQIEIIGGEHESEITSVNVSLVTRIEVESGDSEYQKNQEFARVAAAGRFMLLPKARHTVQFSLQVPWETPLTHVYGHHLRGMTMGVTTELAVARAVDATDLDPIAVHPLPAQERLLEAFAQLGFRFRSADCEQGRIYGVNQTLPFYQEIEFLPPPQYARGINQLEVTFIAGPRSMDVVLELDKRGGLFTEGRDVFGHFTVDYATVGSTDWASQLDAWLRQSAQRRGLFF